MRKERVVGGERDGVEEEYKEREDLRGREMELEGKYGC